MTTSENGHGYRIEALGPQTWDAFADLAGRHNGVWGGCWCTYFHRGADDSERTQLGNQAYKQRLVEQGRAHAALVFDGDVAVAWCQFGTVEELPNIHHRKEWEQGLVRRPDFRITCLFVDRRYRRKGVAATAVRGALELIGIAGGGLVEAYPHDLPTGKKTSASFLYNATRTMYEQLGFTYQRPKGQGNCVMTKEIPASSDGGGVDATPRSAGASEQVSSNCARDTPAAHTPALFDDCPHVLEIVGGHGFEFLDIRASRRPVQERMHLFP